MSAEDFLAYVAAVAAHPAFTARFQDDLSTPGLRIPITADAATFAEAAALGRTVIWLHTFGERFADPDHGRPAQPPRLPAGKRPHIPKDGAIPQTPDAMPDTIDYDAAKQRLLIGSGYVENVAASRVALRSLRQAGPAAMVQLPEARPRAPDHRRPPPAFAARRISSPTTGSPNTRPSCSTC